MSTPVIEVLALVTKSMEMKLPMTVKLHEVSILRAVYAGNVEVKYYRDTDEAIDGPNEMDRLTRVYGKNATTQQPWAETIFGAFGAGAKTLESLYEDDAEAVRAELLEGAEPWPAPQAEFEHPVTKQITVPNIGDEGTAQDPAKIAAKSPSTRKAAAKTPTNKANKAADS